MPYVLHREYQDGEVSHLSLGCELVDEYLDFLRCHARPNTWLNYAHDLKAFLNSISKPVAEITTADVFHFIRCQRGLQTTRGGESTRPHPLSIRTIKRRLCAVSGLYSYLLTRGDTPVQRNPVPTGFVQRSQLPGPGLRTTPLLRTPQTLPHLAPIDQVQRFLASLSSYRDRAIILAMVLGGLRKAEVLGLDLADVDPAQGLVTVRHGKGGRDRVCCMASLFFQVLDRYRRQERPLSTSSKLFLVLKGPRRGQPLSISGLNTIMAHHRRRAQTPDLNCHRLRHTCLTLLRARGMSIEALQEQAGHASINSTRIYLHLSNQVLHDEYFAVCEQLFALDGMEDPNA